MEIIYKKKYNKYKNKYLLLQNKIFTNIEDTDPITMKNLIKTNIGGFGLPNKLKKMYNSITGSKTNSKPKPKININKFINTSFTIKNEIIDYFTHPNKQFTFEKLMENLFTKIMEKSYEFNTKYNTILFEIKNIILKRLSQKYNEQINKEKEKKKEINESREEENTSEVN